ncbi:MAG: imidazolonepropionase [Candidatus Bathyarchaeota archaeon]|nr:imidazolonepropionase [Candidatus Bathyarchaeota archaeon]MDH5732480.1 imidazolonepropionase [Candidatus Bathyarchaeota archaeon]
MVRKEVDLIIGNANELLTLQGTTQKPLIGESMKDVGIIKRGSLAINEGKIIAVGKTKDIKSKFVGKEKFDANEQVVMPGFVDPHTHLVFAGSREDEFEKRIQGVSYLTILKEGGGILKTVKETRRATKQELVEKCQKTLKIMLEHGTTTIEAKSGYGLTTVDEIKCLEVIRLLNDKNPIDIISTFLGAHATPPEYQSNPQKYVNLVIDEMIPTVAKRKLAEFCDVFCEKGVFNIAQSRNILLNAKQHSLKPKLHADELTNIGSAELAAEIDAVSAAHLIFASDEGIRAMAKKGVIAVLLPVAAFSLMNGCYADARKMIDLGVPIALGTDYNPSCPTETLQLIIAFACHQMKMIPAEAISATTINAAYAVHRAHEVGSLEVGKKADVISLNIPNHKFLGYRSGINLVDKVFKEGKLVVDDGRKIYE